MQPDIKIEWDSATPLKEYTGKTNDTEPEPWPERKPAPSLLPIAPNLPDELVPGRLRRWLCDMADRIQIPLEFVAAPAIVALSSVIGRSVGIHPKKMDDWLVVPNLWGAIIGRPGILKSPAISEAIKPLRRLAKGATEDHKAASAEADASADVVKMRMAALDAEGRKAAKTGDENKLTQIQADLAKLKIAFEEAKVHERRYIVNDGTVEKIGELLNQNPRGLLMCRDELSGWLRNLDKTGREGDREFFLEAWNGDGGFTYDRIGRGTLHIEALTLSVLGTIQPGKLQSYINAAIAGGTGDDGLLQRFQVVVWPDVTGDWQNVDRWPDTEAKNAAFAIYRTLDGLRFESVDYDSIPALRFSPEAQEMFNEWRAGLEARLRSDEMVQTPAFESHLAKYRSLMPSLALIFQLVETLDGTSEVGLEAAQNGADWCDFLETHAAKIYASELHPDRAAATALADKIRTTAIEHGTTLREIYNHNWSGLSSPEIVKQGLNLLAQRNWLRLSKAETGGRPSEVIRLHPGLRGTGA